MKRFEINLDARQMNVAFNAIRDKHDIVELLMNSIKWMLLGNSVPAGEEKGQMLLLVSKMSRLFFFSNGKYFSVLFPFSAVKNGSQFTFFTADGLELDHKITSDVIGVVRSQEDRIHRDIYQFADKVIEFNDAENLFWLLIRDMFQFEDGYIRYDHDPVRQSKNDNTHPLDHLDVFYSRGATFKVGLEKKIPEIHLIDILNTDTDCHFVNVKSKTLKQ